MTTRITYQRAYSPATQAPLNITLQRAYAVFLSSLGVTITLQRLFVPFIADGAPAGRRRQIINS